MWYENVVPHSKERGIPKRERELLYLTFQREGELLYLIMWYHILLPVHTHTYKTHTFDPQED